ncbi:MAG: type I-E CRISPR-associated endoribonuclease Cas2e [Anaeromyxobacteraceae bacterium]
MAMTLVVTRDVPQRFRGFLASCMLEIAPGVYTSPDMTRGVRDRVWAVLSSWFGAVGRGDVVLAWNDPGSPCGLEFRVLGDPPKDLHDENGVVLVRRALSTSDRTLTTK